MFVRDLSFGQRTLEVVSHGVLLMGVLGVTGSILRVWPDLQFTVCGLLGAVLARVFHWWYSSLQERQVKISNERSSDMKFANMIEEVVIHRLNLHRDMRTVLGYIIMLLYYFANLYYCMKFVIVFSKDMNLAWAISFAFAAALEICMIEPLIIYAQVEAVNYLKLGGSQFAEAVSRVIINDDFLRTFN